MNDSKTKLRGKGVHTRADGVNTGANKIDMKGKFLELFAGKARLTAAVRKHADVCIPQDIFNARGEHRGIEYDLTNPRVVKQIKAMIRRGEIRWLHCAPPCKTFSKARRRDKWGRARILRSEAKPMGFNQWDPQTKEANKLAVITAQLCRAQRRAGGWFSIENHSTASCERYQP